MDFICYSGFIFYFFQYFQSRNVSMVYKPDGTVMDTHFFCWLGFFVWQINNAGLKALVILLIVAGPFYWWWGRVTTNSQGTKIPFFEIGNYIKEHMNSQYTVGVNSFGIIGMSAMLILLILLE